MAQFSHFPQYAHPLAAVLPFAGVPADVLHQLPMAVEVALRVASVPETAQLARSDDVLVDVLHESVHPTALGLAAVPLAVLDRH